MKKTILILLVIFQWFWISCHSSETGVRKHEHKANKPEREALIISDDFLLNQNRNNIIHTSRSEYLRKVNKKPIGIYRGYGEAVGMRTDVKARLLADQRALLDIASQIRVTVRSITSLQKNDMQSSFSQEITTSTLSTLKNAHPTRWYDESRNTFYTIMEINRNLVYNEIQALDRRVREEAVYYFKKALSEQKFNKFSLALRHYLYAYYISAQSQNNIVEYYDRSTRRTLNVLIESKSRIKNLLEKLDFHIPSKSPSNRQKLITFRATFDVQKTIPLRSIPLNIMLYQNSIQKSYKVTTDYQGQALLSLKDKFVPALPIYFEIGIDFSQLVENISNEFFGFPDHLFNVDITNVLKRFPIYLEPVFIDVLYCFDGGISYGKPQLRNIQKENIHFIFTDADIYKNQIKQILRTGRLDSPFLTNQSLVIIGQIAVNDKKWGEDHLIIGNFAGIYADMKNKKIIKNLNFDIRAYGPSRDASISDFFTRLNLNLFNALLDQE